MKYWYIIDGLEIKISEMSTSHIRNCIKLINERPGWRDNYLPALKEELLKRNLIKTTKLGKHLYED